MNVKVQSQWFDKRSTDLTPKARHDCLCTGCQDVHPVEGTALDLICHLNFAI